MYKRQAIDAANDGDTIYVYSGTYYENIQIDKTINLIGEDKNTTIINGGGESNVVYIIADYVNISGFTIVNSTSSGIFVTHSDYVNISNNIIHHHTENGIWIYVSNYSIIFKNHLYNNEAGIGVTCSTHIKILKNEIHNNTGEICMCI